MTLLTISIILLLLDIIYFIGIIIMHRVLIKCYRIQQEGKVFVKILAETQFYGWMMSRDILALQNSTRAREEHIRIECKDEVRLVQVQAVKEVQRVKSILRIVKENL